MSVDLVLKNGLIVTEDRSYKADLAIKDEKIVSISEEMDVPENTSRVIDCQGKLVLPGLVDPHTHFGVAYPYAEDCETESAAAAAGGVTTVFKFIRTNQAFYDDFLAERIATAQQNMKIDFCYHLGVQSVKHIEDIPRYVSKFGTKSFKVYLGYEPGNVLGIVGAEHSWLYYSMRQVQELGLNSWVCVHAEDISLIKWQIEELKTKGAKSLAAWSECRPDFGEELGVRTSIFLSSVTGCPLYVPHTTIGTKLESLMDYAVDLKARVTFETCPHYLVFDKDNSLLGAMGKVNPPLRSAAEVEALWKAINMGIVTTIGSDHFAAEPKSPEDDLWTAPPGFVGAGETLPVMFSEGVSKGRIGLPKLVELCCANPAKVFGLWPRKGVLAVGSDADIVVFDPKGKTEVKPTAKGTNLYAGMKLDGSVCLTLLRGRVVFENGKVTEETRGQWLQTT